MPGRVRSLLRLTWPVSAIAFLSTLAAPVLAAPPPMVPRPSLSLSVNCNAGQTVSAALARAAYTFTPVVITITGVCAERVVIARDDVTLQGAAPGAGLTSPTTGSATLLTLDGARRITLHQLTLTFSGGNLKRGLELWRGAAASLSNFVIDAADYGVLLHEGTLAEMRDCEIRNSARLQIGVTGGHLGLFGGTIENGGSAVTVERGTLDAEHVTIRDHAAQGISVLENASALISQVELTGNQWGIAAINGGRATVGPGRIADNLGDGIIVSQGSTVSVGSTIIENNFDGVRVEGGSFLQIGNATIRNNRGSGISLADTSLARHTGGSAVITGNTKWGISCGPSPAVAQVMPNGFPATAVTDNGFGVTNCPPLGIANNIP
jgi:hypothetical protein